jgi:polysaccharide deacetylase 2 family uncharacterized protein YibQ
MDWRFVIRRIARWTEERAGDGALAVLFVGAVAVGGPSALAGLGKFAEAITPGMAAQASVKIVPDDRRQLALTGFATPSLDAPHVLPSGEGSPAPAIAQPVPDQPAETTSNPPLAQEPPLRAEDSVVPAIAICIDDLGPDMTGTRKAIGLPENVTLSFLPYAAATPRLAREAETRGHEVLAHVPMEAIGGQDPGPMTLKVDSPQIPARLAWALARVPGLKGINNHEGSKFSTDVASLAPVAEALAQRHLFFFDSRTIAGSQIVRISHLFGVPSAGRDVFLDDILSVSAIQAQLDRLLEKARRTGIAIAIGHPHDITLAVLSAWLAQNHDVRLVPVSEAIRLKTNEAALMAAR